MAGIDVINLEPPPGNSLIIYSWEKYAWLKEWQRTSRIEEGSHGEGGKEGKGETGE